eukprot:g10251.t1
MKDRVLFDDLGADAECTDARDQVVVKVHALWVGLLVLAAGWVAGNDAKGKKATTQLAKLSTLPKPVPAPKDNPTTAEKVSLGKQLFFDSRLSGDNNMSCATCHLPDKAFADGLAGSKGYRGKVLSRNTPTVLNTAYFGRLLWDGRAKSLEEQSLGPITSPDEMHQDLDELEKELNAVPGYVKQFRKIYNTKVTRDGIARSLAAFQRTLVTGPSPFDRYLAGQTNALSDQAKRGFELFQGDAGCIRCHHGPLLSDGKLYRLGVSFNDKGQGLVSKQKEDNYKFRTPALRNVAETGPYMHDGSLKTLSEVVTFYYRNVPASAPDGEPLDVNALLGQSLSDVPDIVAFLKSLSGEVPAGINSARAGDVVLVAPGRYQERIHLKPGITVKSAGDDTKGTIGLKRAEATILDGRFKGASGPGVDMAEGATLDGFTVTGVGTYDDAKWKKHHATYGEEQSHEHIGAPGTAGIAVMGVSRCTVTNNIVHHIGYTGIAIMGSKGKRVSPHIFRNITYRNMGGGIGSMKKSTATIEGNVCFQNYYAGIGHDDASPLVINNVCYENVRAGIGISEHSCPVVRNNKCYRNRRAGIGIRTGAETQPIVEHNECYENGMAGIGNRDEARPVIRHNRCYKNKMAGIGSRDGARGVIEDNTCFENGMSGIGSRLGAAPVIRNNKCYRNLMAGIGSREKAAPVIEGNECYENKMAGIGSQQDAAPVIRNNRCYRNEMAGIGTRSGARPLIVGNTCYENKLAGIGSRSGARPVIVDNESRKNHKAGIGVRGAATAAVVVGNRCLENRLVAIGLPDGATAYIHGNVFKRTGGGAPPLVAVRGGSKALISHNSISGGGVAGVLVQGEVGLFGNRFQGAGGRQGSAVWVWKGSTVNAAGNHFAGYRNAVNAGESKVTATDNVIRDFSGPSIIVKKPSSPARVFGNVAISDKAKAPAVLVDGAKNAAAENILKKTGDVNPGDFPAPQQWPQQSGRPEGDTFHPLAGSGRTLSVQDGPWKLVVTYGKTINYALYNTQTDPDQKVDLSATLEQITFRLRGLIERQPDVK